MMSNYVLTFLYLVKKKLKKIYNFVFLAKKTLFTKLTKKKLKKLTLKKIIFFIPFYFEKFYKFFELEN
jgi:hypothetical protein